MKYKNGETITWSLETLLKYEVYEYLILWTNRKEL